LLHQLRLITFNSIFCEKPHIVRKYPSLEKYKEYVRLE